MLGSGEAPLERPSRRAAAAHPEPVAVRIGFDDGLARRIYAGADLFLMPSRYEPCGLGQLIALRYGDRAGRPADRRARRHRARVDRRPARAPAFCSTSFRAGRLLARRVARAFAAHADPRSWSRLVRNAMASRLLLGRLGRVTLPLPQSREGAQRR